MKIGLQLINCIIRNTFALDDVDEVLAMQVQWLSAVVLTMHGPFPIALALRLVAHASFNVGHVRKWRRPPNE